MADTVRLHSLQLSDVAKFSGVFAEDMAERIGSGIITSQTGERDGNKMEICWEQRHLLRAGGVALNPVGGKSRPSRVSKRFTTGLGF